MLNKKIRKRIIKNAKLMGLADAIYLEAASNAIMACRYLTHLNNLEKAKIYANCAIELDKLYTKALMHKIKRIKNDIQQIKNNKRRQENEIEQY